MTGNILYKAGKLMFPVVGPIHDQFRDTVETPTLDSDTIEMLEFQENPAMPGSVANTIYYYVGGTAIVVGVLVFLAGKYLPALPAKMRSKAATRSRYRARMKKSTTRAKPRRTYRRKTKKA